MEYLIAENKLLLVLLKTEPSLNEVTIINNLFLSISDWNYFFDSAVIHGIGSLVLKQLKRQKRIDIVPKEFISGLDQIYMRTVSRNIILYEYFQKIQQAFSKNKIPVIPLKGIFLADNLYQDIGLRQMSDIDLLVKNEDTGKCIDILSKMGFVARGRDKTEFMKTDGVSKHLPTMVLNGVMVEIHYRIVIDDSIYMIDLDEYWKNALPVSLFNASTLALSPENLVQYLCIHLEIHFNEGRMQLYHFADIIGILQKHEKTFDWDAFELSCKKNHCEKNVFTMLFLLEKYFSFAFPRNIHEYISRFSNLNSENRFRSYLKCNKKEITSRTKIQNIKNIRKIKGAKNRMRYLLGDIFPSRSFMNTRYKIKFKPMVFVYYFLRVTKGIGLLFIHVFRKIFLQ